MTDIKSDRFVEIGEQLVENGVALIARGLFRIGDKSKGNNPQAAYDIGLAAVNTIRGMAFDFLKQVNKVRDQENA